MPGAYAMPATYRSATARTEALGLGLAPEGEWLDRALFGELAIADTAEELVRGTAPLSSVWLNVPSLGTPLAGSRIHRGCVGLFVSVSC
jgi:hypothetical protein